MPAIRFKGQIQMEFLIVSFGFGCGIVDLNVLTAQQKQPASKQDTFGRSPG